ncbi:MAG: hypothetical protein M3Y56_01715 [Armatimonadota bacterium]|nr:hypothetical protein [Armatimonadota bacterium]
MSQQNVEKFEQQVAEAEKEHQKEIRAGEMRSWGDRKTWLFLSALILGVFLSCVITYILVGTGTATTIGWHLGTPGTAPG